jgi:alanine racemase
MEELYDAFAPVCRTAAFVSLKAIRHNGAIARKLFPEQKILSVLKADCYGHGIAGVMPAYDTFSDYYAVATVEEGLTARAGTEKPVLLFGPVPEAQRALAAQMDLTFTVGSLDYATRLSNELVRKELTAKCHLKIETGLNRSGVRWRGPEALETLKAIQALPALEFTGTYTHFACGEGQEDWELAFTKQQFDRFFEAITAMEAAGLAVGLRHCTSTGGSLAHPEYRLDMVRLGMLPMGMSFSDENADELGLIPSLTWVSWITQIEDLPAGEAVSYSCIFRAEKDMKIAMVSCGYADGYRRAYSNKTQVIVGGKKVRVLGRIAMDYMLIDVTDVDVKVGSPVILLGTDGTNRVSAQDLMQYGESVSGEVTCAISPRVRRIYTEVA